MSGRNNKKPFSSGRFIPFFVLAVLSLDGVASSGVNELLGREPRNLQRLVKNNVNVEMETKHRLAAKLRVKKRKPTKNALHAVRKLQVPVPSPAPVVGTPQLPTLGTPGTITPGGTTAPAPTPRPTFGYAPIYGFHPRPSPWIDIPVPELRRQQLQQLYLLPTFHLQIRLHLLAEGQLRCLVQFRLRFHRPPLRQHPVQPSLQRFGSLQPTPSIAKAEEVTLEPTDAPTLFPTTEGAKATFPPTVEALDSSIPSSITVDELKDLGIDLESTLEFSLWFPEYRASQLNINAAENGVLNSLNTLFCMTENSALTVDSPDDLCVLHNNVINMAVAKSPGQGKDHEDPDASIVLAPHVDYLDERYASYQDRRYYWTTWKVSFELFQLGRPILQRAMAAFGADSEELSKEAVFLAGARTIQDEMKRSLDMSIRNGEFDSLLSSHFTGVDVFSSPVGEELAIFGAIGWNFSDAIPDNSLVEPKENGKSNQPLIIAIAIMSVLLLISIGAYISLVRSRSREVWRSEREIHMLSTHYQPAQPEQPARRSTPDTGTGPGEVSTLTNTKGSMIPAEIDLQVNNNDNESLPASLPASKTDDGDSLPMTNPSTFVRRYLSEGVSFGGDRDNEDAASRVSSSVDLAWSVKGVDTPWRPPQKVDYDKLKAPSSN